MEIQRFLNHGIIEKANENTECEYISNIFTRQKSDGRIRIILNLKQFNKQYGIHFKMETLQSAITAMRQNCYFGSVDISDAYYTIPIDENDRRLFNFEFEETKYQFTSLVMGNSKSPLVFTKNIKACICFFTLVGIYIYIYKLCVCR